MKSVCVSLNKKWLKYTVLTAFSFFLVLSSVAVNNRMNKAVSNLNVASQKTVILDAGHGGFDGGTTSVYGVPEKDINLKIALKTQKVLTTLGYNVVMTRTEDSALKGTKKEDMYERLKITRKYPDSVFVSIHQNYFSEEKYFGAQMFYGHKNEEESIRFAQILQQNFKQNITPQNTRQIKKSPSDLFLFKNAPQPCVLVECGFLSNKNEAMLLSDNTYQTKIAFTISQGITEYLNQTRKDNKNGSTEV